MLVLDLSHFPMLTTDGLILRELTDDDTPALFTLRSDERVMQYLGRPHATTLEDAEKLIATVVRDRSDNNGITWALTLKGNDTLIGTIGFYRLQKPHFRAEVGYLLHPDHWRKGLMGEALNAVVEHAFNAFGFHSIEAVTDPQNVASNQLLSRHGFVREGLFRENYFWNGKFYDSAVWSRLKGWMIQQ
ncbi:MAG: GNAT family N-acetyltransferase [Bacteroidota bacterium]|nr:GNAT family N-acetyltransferase [Bacteroidota bacterium]